jgi:tRNA(Ile)-lysidine synthase TilS/MesJ
VRSLLTLFEYCSVGSVQKTSGGKSMEKKESATNSQISLKDKFINTLERYDLIPQNKNRIYIFYSGGKDASSLADLMLWCKQKIRPDLELTLMTVLFPEVVYKSPDLEQVRAVNEALGYWKNKGYHIRLIDLPDAIGDHLFEGKETPCEVCESVKNKIIFDELSMPDYAGSLVCIAHTLNDVVGYLSEIQFIAGSYSSWRNLMESNTELFNRVLVLAKRVYPKYEPNNLQITYIKPLIEFEEKEIKHYVMFRDFPLIPEVCAEKRGPKFKIYKRFVMDGLEWLDKRYAKKSFYDKLLFNNYSRIINFFNNTYLLPPVEEIQKVGFQSGI